MVKVFRDNVRGVLAGVCCAAVVVCSGVYGMEIDTIHVSEREQFFQITTKQSKNVKSISFENQSVDEDFLAHWVSLFIGHNFDDLSFDKCCFASDAFSILNGATVINLAVKSCHITVDISDEVLRYVYPHSIRSIDLSGNELGKCEDSFELVLQNRIYNLMSLTLLNLKGNGFSMSFIDHICGHLNPSITKIVF
jgi:hypothetical protein